MSDNLTPAQRQWVDALRSGEYEQTTNVLCRLNEDDEPVGFCCLGVACDLALKAGIDLKVSNGTLTDAELAEDDDPIRCLSYGGATAALPPVVRAWLGLSDGNDNGMYGGGMECLAGRNDAGASFGAIADIIESRPAGLFEVSS